jgi:hypothetical protein
MSRSDKQMADEMHKHNLAKQKIEELWKSSPGSFNATEVAKQVDHIQPTFSRALFPTGKTEMKPPHVTYKH